MRQFRRHVLMGSKKYELVYQGSIADLSIQKDGVGMGYTGDYILIAAGGGRMICGEMPQYKNTEAYDSNFTKTFGPSLSTEKYKPSSGYLNGCCIFAGGQFYISSDDGFTGVNTVEAISSDLTITSMSPVDGGGGVGITYFEDGSNLIAAGGATNSWSTSKCFSYDTSFIKHNLPNMPDSSTFMATGHTKNHCFVACGLSSSLSYEDDPTNPSSYTCAFDRSLTMTSMNITSRTLCKGGSLDEYFFIIGGHRVNSKGVEYVYNDILTVTDELTVLSAFSVPSPELNRSAVALLKGMVLFNEGTYSGSTKNYILDENLVLSQVASSNNKASWGSGNKRKDIAILSCGNNDYSNYGKSSAFRLV